MTSQAGKLKEKLRDIMKAIPPCSIYDTLPISFDVDKFIAPLQEKGYICTVQTTAGLQVVL